MKRPTPPAPSLPKRLSLVAQTVQSLCEAIRAGHWQEFLPGERELCERLQVSRRTIRTALGQLKREGWIESAQRQRRRICHRPAARAATRGPMRVALLSPVSFGAMSQIPLLTMDTVREKLARTGCTMELHVSPSCFSAHPARALEKLTRSRPASVWLLMHSREPTQRWFARAGVGCLVLGSCHAGVALPSVDVDYRAACRHAGALLWRKGHRRIALVRPRVTFGGDVESEEGLREALPAGAAQLRVLRHEGAAERLAAALHQLMRGPEPPTVFVVTRPILTINVIMHLLHRGLRIPRDVAVISRDDDSYLQSITPSVARYAVDPAQMARRIATTILQLAETGSLPPRAIRVAPRFIAGETV